MRDAPKTDVATSGYTVGSQYTFVPEVTSQTRLQTSGSGWRSLTWSSSDSRKFKGFHAAGKNNLKGNMSVRYTNVGYYKGQKVDLKIIVNDWSEHGRNVQYNGASPIGNISFQEDRIAMSTQGYNWVDVTWEFVKAGTNTKLPVSGYFTFSDIDIRQGIEFSQASSSNIDRFVIQSGSHYLNYANNGGKYKFYDTVDSDKSDQTYDGRFAFTFLYSNQSAFRLRWSTDWNATIRNNRPVTPDRYYYLNVNKYANGEYMFYMKNKPAKTAIPKPKKTTTKEVVKGGEEVRYDIKHTVPQESEKYHYSSYTLEDYVDKAVSNLDIDVFDESDQNVTNLFTIYKGDNHVRAVAKASTLRNPSFYGKEYRLRIIGKLNSSYVRGRFSGGKYVFDNVSSAIVNGSKYQSNVVYTRVDERIITVKHVDDETGKDIVPPTTHSMVDNDTYTFDPRQDLKTSDGYKYKPLTSSQSGKVTGNKTITFRYEKPKTVTIRHLDDDDGKLLASSTHRLYLGDSYSYSARSDLKTTDGDAYKALAPTQQSGTISGNTTIDFRYTKPRLITINHIDDDTDKVIARSYEKKYDGEKYTYEPRQDLKTHDGYKYKPMTGTQAGTVDGATTVNFRYERPRVLLVRHVDDDDDSVIATETHRLYRGDPYEFTSREDFLYLDKYKYYPLAPLTQQGTVQEDASFEFRYTKPSLSLGLDYIQIKTDRATNGLPVHLEFDLIKLVDRWDENTVSLSVFNTRTDEKVFAESYDVADVEDGVDFEIDSDYLSVDSNDIFEAVIETPNEKKMVITDLQNKINTRGYTASEEVLTVESTGTDQAIQYSGVAMTERYIGQPMRSATEMLSTTLASTVKTITGYGFDARQILTYETGFDGDTLPSISGSILADQSVSEGEYSLKDGKHDVSLSMSVQDETNQRTVTMQVPRVYVAKDSGKVSLATPDTEYVDGGRKMYVPIWMANDDELGTYSYWFTSNRIGRNYVEFNLERDIEVQAYMYGHLDSATLDEDALLVEPSNKDPFEE